MADGDSLGQVWSHYRPSKSVWFWSCVASVVATLIVGFTWGGWVTSGTAAQMSATAADNAEAKLAAAYCVTAFETAPNASTQLAALKKTDSWQRSDFIDKGGWDKLPGEKQAITGAADLCVTKLMSAKLVTPVKANTTTSG
jgi:hypothetical protein